MSARIGMDAQAVRQIATAIDSRAADLERVIGSVDGLVAEISHIWTGDAASDFHEGWVHLHRPALLGLVGTLHDYARTARANAEEQDRASAASGGTEGIARQWLDLGRTLAGHVTSGVEADLESLRAAFPKAVKLEAPLRQLGHVDKALGFLAIGTDGFFTVKDGLDGSFTSNAAMNDELSLTFDVAGLAATAAGGPLAGAAVGALAAGVGVVQSLDPALTADIFRLSPIGRTFEVTDAVAEQLRAGDYNPIDLANKVASDQSAAMADLGHQALTATGAAMSWVGSTASSGSRGATRLLGGAVHDVSGWVHL